jgi:large subunit ribosomal protein L3
MLPGILGRKIGMTHLFDEEGRLIPVTVIQAGPVYVTQVKTAENDGYDAVQVGFEECQSRRLTHPAAGHLKKAGVGPLKVLRELRGKIDAAPGEKFTVEIFSVGDKVKVVGTSKGKGFAGAVKRHHFRGQHMTHGYMTHRRPLSSGATGPARVFKGSRRPGHMGDAQTTQPGARVVQIDAERNLILLSGSVPGAAGGLVQILKTGSK